MAEYRITKHDLIGYIPEYKKNYDKLSAIIVCLNNKMPEEYGGLHHFLNTLLSPDITLEEKKKILEEVFDMTLKNELEVVVNEMCNLSEAIEERGINKGINKVIRALVETCRELGVSKEMTVDRVMDKMSVSNKKASDYVNKYWV